MGDRNKLSCGFPEFPHRPAAGGRGLALNTPHEKAFQRSSGTNGMNHHRAAGVALQGPEATFRETGDPHSGRSRLSSQSSWGLTAPESSVCTQSSWSLTVCRPPLQSLACSFIPGPRSGLIPGQGGGGMVSACEAGLEFSRNY